jgi:hypothetical protein
MKLSEITAQLLPLERKIYENEKAFLKFFFLEGNVINHVTFCAHGCHVLWRHKETQNTQVFITTTEQIQDFFDSLG